ncbi:MAG: hypothetical protein AAF721_15915 [Myxococcota bacterium]
MQLGVLGLSALSLTACPDDPVAMDTDSDGEEPPLCGNGVIEPGEACDTQAIPVTCVDLDFSGGTLSCDAQCQIVATGCTGCGDGSLDPGEECDDGNVASGDGCGAQCTTEAGFACMGSPSVCVASCGNGVLDTGEACDDGDMFPGDGCTETCMVEPGWACAGQPSVCTSQCGNGALEAGEECDSNDFGGETCEGLGFLGGNLICAGNCTVSTAACETCGNGVADPGEDCDGVDLSGFSCLDLGADGGELSCGADCLFDTAGCQTCGNDIEEGDEECDEGVANSDLMPDACRTDCTNPACGDGVIDSGEVCDDGLLNSDTEMDACRTDCMPASCGDTVIDTGEECDPPAAGTCEDNCLETVVCLNCGDFLAGGDGPGCCGSSDLFTGLDLCVCGGMGSDCALSCIDTLCAGLDPTGDDCETCLMGDVDCAVQFQTCSDDATVDLGPEDTPEACADGCNNDVDLTTDCDDSGCFGVGVCMDAELNCGDNEDNDGDMDVDCDDSDCDTDALCAN